MRKVIAGFLVSVTLWAAGGCGTILDATIRDYKGESGPLVYGGVRWDATALLGAYEGITDWEGPGKLAEFAVCGALWAADLPISAAADTLALPFSVCAAYKRLTASAPPAESPPQKGAP
jgi:uncharacterized protein YceK